MSDYINFGAFDFMSEHQQAASSSRPDLEAMLANYPLDFNANPGLSDSLAVGDDSTGTDYVDESNVRSANSGFSNSFGRFDFDNVDYSYQNGVIPHPMPLTSPSAGGFTQGTIDPKQLVLSPFACSFVVTTSHGGVQRNATNINNPGALSNFTFQQSRQQYSANSPGPASYAALPVGSVQAVALHRPPPHCQPASLSCELSWLDSTTHQEQWARPQIPTPRPVCTAGPNMHDTLGEAHGTSLPGWSPGDSEAQPLQHAFLNDRVCSECSLTFPAQASRSSPSLVKHAAQSKHKSFGCICGNSYNRKDVLKRHIIAADGAQSDIYCHLCARSFGRKDHLTQHLRGFHHGDFRVFDLLAKHSGIHTGAPGLDRDSIYVCPHAGCPANRSEAWIAAQSVSGSDQWPFKSFLTFYLHMAHIHDEIAYTCPAESCSRLKGKYFRFPETFENHCRVEHKVEVKAERREEFLPFCARAGCGLRLVQGQYSWLFRCPNSVEDKKDQYGYIQWRHL